MSDLSNWGFNPVNEEFLVMAIIESVLENMVVERDAKSRIISYFMAKYGALPDGKDWSGYFASRSRSMGSDTIMGQVPSGD